MQPQSSVVVTRNNVLDDFQVEKGAGQGLATGKPPH
jgi:hypothetical protein